jgi:transposase-like protein
MLRTGLRNDDVNLLTNAYRAARDGGAGPDEAWSLAKGQLKGVDPDIMDNWRNDVEKAADGGTAANPRVTTANVMDRNAELTEENGRLKKSLADAGARLESMLSEPQKEIEHLKKLVDSVTSENSSLKSEVSHLKEQLAAAEELLGGKKKK